MATRNSKGRNEYWLICAYTCHMLRTIPRFTRHLITATVNSDTDTLILLTSADIIVGYTTADVRVSSNSRHCAITLYLLNTHRANLQTYKPTWYTPYPLQPTTKLDQTRPDQPTAHHYEPKNLQSSRTHLPRRRHPRFQRTDGDPLACLAPVAIELRNHNHRPQRNNHNQQLNHNQSRPTNLNHLTHHQHLRHANRPGCRTKSNQCPNRNQHTRERSSTHLRTNQPKPPSNPLLHLHRSIPARRSGDTPRNNSNNASARAGDIAGDLHLRGGDGDCATAICGWGICAWFTGAGGDGWRD